MLLSLLFSFLFATETQTLAIGESFSINSSPLQDLQLKRKGIVSINDLGHRLVFTGKKIGTTQIQLGEQRIHLQVIPRQSYRSLNKLQDWLKGKRGPRLDIKTDFIVITGRLLSLRDFKHLTSFLTSKDKVRISTDLSDQLKQQITQHIKTRLIENNLTSGSLIFKPHIHMLLSKQQVKDKKRYQALLNPYGITIQKDESLFVDKSVIKIRVYIAHVTKNFLRSWGIKWPNQIQTQLIPGQAAQLNQLTIGLNALEQKGWGKMLATPTLVTESGQQAQFHSGGEFPIRNTTQFNNTLQWKQYGLFLKTTPTANAQGHLRISINLEISSLDHSVATDGIPALIRNKVQTQINMKTPRPFLLSGFLKQTDKDQNQGLPWLRQIPILSPLFASGDIYNSELELVFLMIPEFYHE